ncbi:MAG: methyltransferase domain-containing protein [Bryobacteraceae bacterium]
MSREPAPELTRALESEPPGTALDLACGAGRHARWLAARGWDVTAEDIAIEPMEGVRCIRGDLELRQFVIEPGAWDLIVCWLYWQADLLPDIAAGVRPGGVVALAGKTSGRFATSLAQFRAAFSGWIELDSGEDAVRCFLIVRRAGEEAVD